MLYKPSGEEISATTNVVRETLKVKRNELAKQFPLIKVKKKGDVGYDLPAIIDNKKGYVWLFPFFRKLIATGIQVEIPEGYWAAIEARSSTSKLMVIVPKGVIDTGYRGELFAQLLNVSFIPRKIHNGDRLVQLIMHENLADKFDIEEVDELSPSERGATGFGSTGK